MTLLVLLLSLQSIQADYYGPQSADIAAMQVEQLPFSGDSLYWAINYIARANYKIGSYDRADQLAWKIPEDSIRHRFLYFDVLSLRALTSKTLGRFTLADSLYSRLFAEIPSGYYPIKYRSYLNRAELRRLQVDYEGREADLLRALTYADSAEADKVRRVLARHYFKVELRFSKAESILSGHTPYRMLTGEDKAGYELVRAELAEAQQRWRQARAFYRRAYHTAQQARFPGFARDAADGQMRTKRLQAITRRQAWGNTVKIAVLVTLVIIITYKYARRD